MSTTDLKIKDSEFFEAGKNLDAFCKALKGTINQYKTIVKSINYNAIPSGKTHDALERYSEYIEELEGIVDGIGKSCVTLTKNFIGDIESADDYLYDAKIVDAIRDFSDDEYQRLLKCLDDPWCEMTDNIDNWFMKKVNGFVDFFDWDSQKSRFQNNKKRLLDYNDETKQGLKALFDRVKAIDRKRNFVVIEEILSETEEILNVMVEIIDPNNKNFTVSAIDDKLGEAFKKLKKLYTESIEIAEEKEPPTIEDISDFISHPWSYIYFSDFSALINEFILDIGGMEAFNMILFNGFDIARDTVLIGDYETQKAEEQLMDTFQNLLDNYEYDGSDEEEILNQAKTFLDYVKKYGDKWYDYMREHRTEDGRLMLDLRTKEGKAFKEMIESLGGAAFFLKYGEKTIEFLVLLWGDYSKGLKILDSFERNYNGDETVMNAIDNIRELYNKEFKAWILKALDEVQEIGLSVLTKQLKKVKGLTPVLAVVDAVEEVIDGIGLLTGEGDKSKAMYDAVTYHKLYCASSIAYDNASEAFRDADPESPEYEQLAKDMENCFNLHKLNIIKMLESMAKASDGTKQSYYEYCAKQAEMLSLKDDAKPEIMSYEEFLKIA